MKQYSVRLILMLATLLPSFSVAQINDPETIVVIGRGRVTATPDVGVISLTVEGTESTSDSAAAIVAARVQRILDTIGNLDVAGVEVVTETYTVQPGRRDQRTQEPIEHKATMNLSIRVAGVTDVGGVIDAALMGGAVQIRGLRFEVSDSDILREGALAAALEDARGQADLIARTMGVELEFRSATTAPPQYSAGSMALDQIVVTGVRGRRATPVRPLDASSSVTVTMRFGVVRSN